MAGCQRSRSASGVPRPPDPGVVSRWGAVSNFRDIGLLHEVLDLHAFAMADIVLHRCGIDPSEAVSVSQRILVSISSRVLPEGRRSGEVAFRLCASEEAFVHDLDLPRGPSKP